MSKRSVNLLRNVSSSLLGAAVKVDSLVTNLRESGIREILRRDARAYEPVSDVPPPSRGRGAWDMRTIPPPSASVPPPAPPAPPPIAAPSAYPSPLGVLRNTFDPRIPGATRRQYRESRPWAQPSPHIPDGLAHTVLNVADDEVDEFMSVVVGRYIRTLHRYWVKAAAYALKHPGAEEVSDAQFARILDDTPASQPICRTLDPRDRSAFGALLDADKLVRGCYAKIDLSNMHRLEPRPGIFVAGTVTLLERDGAQWAPRAIRINGLTVEPKHVNAYELAKYFVLQGCANSLLVGSHPNVHFPMDAVNAVTRSLLPEDHTVRLLLEPHFYLQLPLNYAVLYINKSVLKNDQREIYTPFVGRMEPLFAFMADYHRGVPGNSAMPGYRYGLGAPDIPSGYGNFLKAYFDVILEFTTSVLKSIPKGDPYVRLWSEHLANVVSGFPGPDEIFEDDTLARAAAFFIWDVAVLHTLDHRGYAEVSVNQMPLRMRVPPPASLDIAPVRRSLVLRKEDVFRHRMARIMYFRPAIVRRLVDAAYAFEGADESAAARDFMRRLRELDAIPEMRKRCPLDEIAISIQF